MLRSNALAGGVVVLALMGAGCAGKEELAHQLSEYEANLIVHVLSEKDVKAHKELEEGGRIITYKIVVSGADKAKGLKILVDNQLPRPKIMGGKTFYDPANRPLIPTATQERAEFILALQGDLAEKLRSTIPGVVQADVTIQKPERDVVRDLAEKAPAATAAVTIVYNRIDGKAGPPVPDEKIARLIAASVEGMDWQNVMVVQSEARSSGSVIVVNDTEDAAQGATGPAAAPFLGISATDEAGRKRLVSLMSVAGIFGGVMLLAFLLAIGVAFKFRSEAATAKANVHAMSKKRKEPEAPPAPG